MKKYASIILISLQILFLKEAYSKHCYISFMVDSIVISDPDTLFNSGVSIDYTITAGFFTSQECDCDLQSVVWEHNGMYTNSFTYNIIDTGYYQISFFAPSTLCQTGYGFVFFHVGVNTSTAISESDKAPQFQMYPSISSGIFHLRSSQPSSIKKIIVTDSSCRNIFSSDNTISAIDLTRFSPGIYYYAITDEKENVFRGRIVKE